MIQPVTLDDVRAAEARLTGLIAVTPCPYSETLSVLTGSRVFVKLENLQMTGSFKERGAANVLLALGETEVELTLETSGRDHIDAVTRHLRETGYTVEEVLHR